MKPAVLRPLAEQDLLHITRWYSEQGGSRLGGRAFDAARKALARIEQMPALGSLRFGERCNLPGLRHWSVEKFPIRWFYKPIDPALYAAQWVEQVADVEFDLKAVNPREKKVVDSRTPAQLLVDIARKGQEVDAALAALQGLLGQT